MDVAALQKHLSDLAGFVRDAGANATVGNQITAAAEALAPFRGYKIDQFAAFLKIAEEYHRAGVTPDKVPAKRGTGGAGKGKAPAGPTAAEVIDRVATFYQTAGDPSVTAAQVEQELTSLGKLKKAEMLQLAARIGVEGLAKAQKSNPAILDVLRKAVRDRKGMRDRPNY
jgi:hypothetical protein